MGYIACTYAYASTVDVKNVLKDACRPTANI